MPRPTIFNQHLPSPVSPLDQFVEEISPKEVKLFEAIGRGSYGTVRIGIWKKRTVAVKIFQTAEERESFEVEVQQLSCVKHPNIITLYGACTKNLPAYLVMEYAESGSLNHLLHETDKPYDLNNALSWALQTAKGVAYLHNMKPKPIMHRDLKPANLLLFSGGSILKICDFGTACAVRTQMTNNTGSASYMAPEVFKTSSYHEKCDVFSWAIILWEVLARRRPFFNNEITDANIGPYQIMWAINSGERPKSLENCPEEIENLMQRSWAVEPTTRPSMLDIVEEMKYICTLCGQYSDTIDHLIISPHTKLDARFKPIPPDGVDHESLMLFRQQNRLNSEYLRLTLEEETLKERDVYIDSIEPNSDDKEFARLRNEIKSLRKRKSSMIEQFDSLRDLDGWTFI